MRHTNPVFQSPSLTQSSTQSINQTNHQTPEGQIICPHCGDEISLSEALRSQFAEKFEKEYQKKAQVAAALIKQKEDLLNKKAQLLDREYLEKMAAEREIFEKKLREKLEQTKNIEMEDLKNQIAEQKKRLTESMNAELELRKKTRNLEEKEKTFELDLVKKMDSEKVRIEEEVSKRLSEDQHFKMAEKDKQLEDMRRKIEDLKRRSDITSQQLQGEVLELELESMLKKFCIVDSVEPVAKGARGGDIIQKVMTNNGQHAGTIVWETKRTKAWSDSWIEKIKEDQRAISAECAVVVSTVLPKGLTGLGLYQGVWVCDCKTAPGLVTALRVYLLHVHSAKASMAGKDAKTEIMYRYLTGTSFAQRIQSMVESYKEMQESLHVEKKAYQKIWAQREQQLEKVILNTAFIYGSIQGIVGGTLPRIEGLEIQGALAARFEDDDLPSILPK